jgi:UDP:flavonoid glycosyltransferase YjiC (YdhE family)
MARFVLCNFPTSGQINPTHAVVQELVARGDEVVYFTSGRLRATIEATGATSRAFEIPSLLPTAPRPMEDSLLGGR